MTQYTGVLWFSSKRQARANRAVAFSSTSSSGASGCVARTTARAYASVCSRPGIRVGHHSSMVSACFSASSTRSK